MEPEELERAVEAVLFAAGEPVELKRLSQALGCETGEVQEAANRLMDRLGFERRGVRLVRQRRCHACQRFGRKRYRYRN